MGDELVERESDWFGEADEDDNDEDEDEDELVETIDEFDDSFWLFKLIDLFFAD